MDAIPTGTVSFLFTDVAGSTRLWESDRAGMETSLAAHDQILRRAIDANRGVVFATGGDSFSAAFRTAAQAVQAAVSAQLSLDTHGWAGPRLTVRMGIHTGAAEERDANYYGPEVTRAARIMAAGHGGQTLLSETSAGLVRDVIPAPLTLVDLGTHDLKDLDRPERLFEVRHPELPVVETPLATRPRRGFHLPEQLTSFVGRSDEIATVTGLIDGNRVVTLTGVGGTGKTRLAIEAARVKADEFAHGAWIAELASVTDHDLVLTQIADVWGLRPGEGADLIKVVSTFLSTRDMLLVVDNCEHVLEEVSRLLAELLRAGPGLKVLATSRESLGITGETVYRVPSLALPPDEETALRSDAVTLFLERFRSARPDYTPTAEDLAAIVRVCRRLDGIPLGLELAAARLRSMSPVELADHLNESFRILTGAAKTALPRQRTLQATIDWSYDLLEPDERAVFRRASCFIGGFDLDAATSVAGGGSLDEWEVLDLVDQLVDKSLLAAVSGGAGTRYRMLEPIRQYAQEELVDEGESEEAHIAHAAHYAGLVNRIAPALRNEGQKQAHDSLRLELDNIRAALAELRDGDRIDEFLQMCFDLAIFWSQASMQVEGLDVLLGVLDTDPEADAVHLAQAWWAASLLAFNLTDPRSVDYGLHGLRLASAAEDDVAIAWTSLITAAAISGTTDRTDGGELFDRGKRLLDAHPDRSWWDPAWDRMFAGWVRLFLHLGSPEEMMADMTETIDAARVLGDRFTAAGIMTGAFFIRRGDDDAAALGHIEEAVRILSDLGFRHALGHALLYWGWMTRARAGERVGADALAEGAEMLAEIGDLPCALSHSANLIRYLTTSGEVEQAIPHLVFVTRQALADPGKFARDAADAGGLVALSEGDLATAATIAGYLAARQPSSTPEWTSPLESAASPELLAEATVKGARLGDGGALALIGSWAESRAV